ncbi:MAG TPA: DUF2723 domain-containing protein [Flavobacteriales bacterium]|nr:DUF2723 domain-containing protein [Flavobacteriales bacterium]
MNYKNLNNIIGWIIFAIALFVYTATMEDTVSLWDCGEYISTAYKLEVGHPPGAPLFNMLGRIFSAFVSTSNVAWSINFMSALVSAFTILFLFWSITHLAKKMALGKGSVLTDMGTMIAVLGSGAIGALAYTFSDSFWFSAAEGEVYAMSSFFSAAVVWAIFRWEEVADEAGSDRWLILIFFLIGLSIGVHLLNLLAIPAIGYVYYFRKYKTSGFKGVFFAGVISMGILGFVQAVLIPGIVSFPALLERMFKNEMGMPFNFGLILFFILLLGLVIFGLMWTRKKGYALLNTIVNSFIVLCIGYSCFFMITIRSAANTPIDENNPENPISFLSYLNREQYGSWPILYGPYWNSAIDVQNQDGYTVDGNPIFMRGFAVKRDGNLVQGFRTEKEAKDYVAQKKLTGVDIEQEYFVSDDRKGIDYKYKPEHMTFFPRMFSREGRHVHGYKAYSGYDPNDGGESFTDPLTGKTEVLPTFGNNLKFFFNYQVGWMYWRYFLWNFAGRQNDEQGIGPGPLEGNWISGVNFIDKQHVGDQTKVPKSITRNRAHNKFFMLPLILGLIGFVFHFFYARKDWFVILLLFIFTGFMIIVYLNPKPYEPRERDYAYAGSFYAFAFWIGLGVWALFDMAKRISFKQLGIVAAVTGGISLLILAIDSGSGQGFTFSFSMLYILIVSMIMCGLMIFMGSNNRSSTAIATVAILISVPVPILMGSQGWDDHNRSDRTTALDFASNFLETCEKNAIIFTHGDNDTFPLWYAQEVEGIRTDVRVVNLSLLGTDWYIDQMLRAAYDSEPVPFTAPEYMYRQGGLLDYVQLDASKNTKGVFLDLVQAMDYVMNDANMIVGDGGRKYMAIPSRTFSLKVDPKAIEQYKVIEKSEFSKMVGEIQFTVPKGSLYKNDLMILDLIAHNNWKRPVYFAGGAEASTYLGLQDYFSSEGLAYKFVPIQTKSGNPNAYGKVNIDRMYHNVMEVYKWGGMEKPGCNVDYYIRRTMTNNYRLMFYTLAQELATQGGKSERMADMAKANIKMIEDTMAKGFGNKAMLEEQLVKMKETLTKEGANKTEMYEKCKKVIAKCLQVMPEVNVPYDRIMPSFVPILYQIGEKQKAVEIINILTKQEYDNFNYYTSLAPRFCIGTMENAQVSFRIIGMLEQVARDAKDTQTADMVRAKEDQIAMNLNKWVMACIEENQEYAASFAEYFPQLFQQAPQVPPMTPGKPE